MSAWNLTDPFHRAPYAAISPSRPELSQSGKTVLITGGNAGIGYAIAEAFSQASAAKVIILGRSARKTTDAAAQLAREHPGTHVEGLVCDVASPDAVEELWDNLQKDHLVVDVLVLNAVKISSQKPILEAGVDIWGDFDMNVRAQLQMTGRFYKQKGEGVSGPKVCISSYPDSCDPVTNFKVPRQRLDICHPRLESRRQHTRLRPDQKRRCPRNAAHRPRCFSRQAADCQHEPGRRLHPECKGCWLHGGFVSLERR